MKTRVFLINIITLIFVVVSLYFIKTTNTIDVVVKGKDTVISGLKSVVLGDSADTKKLQDAASSTQKKLNKFASQPIAKQAEKQIVTPDPLQQIKKGLGLSEIDKGAVTVTGAIERTNYERSKYSLPGLAESPELDASALIKANDILNKQYFEHTSPDGKTVSDLVTITKYSFVRVGENLALGDFSSNVDLLTAWMNSPGHRANILDKRYEDIGIGIAYGNYQGRYVVVAVQHFGRPRSSCPNVDEQLKNKVLSLQSKIDDLSPSLDVLKSTIDLMRTKGEYVDNKIIDAYNSSVEQYDSIVNDLISNRDTYNAQIKAFNTCLSNL